MVSEYKQMCNDLEIHIDSNHAHVFSHLLLCLFSYDCFLLYIEFSFVLLSEYEGFKIILLHLSWYEDMLQK